MINEHLCQCDLQDGQTVVVSWVAREDGSQDAVCCKCQKLIGYRLNHDPSKLDTPRILGLRQDPDDERKEHIIMIDLSMFGPAAISCGSCREITFWRGFMGALERVCAAVVNEGAALQCPKCRTKQEVPEEWVEMFK